MPILLRMTAQLPCEAGDGDSVTSPKPTQSRSTLTALSWHLRSTEESSVPQEATAACQREASPSIRAMHFVEVSGESPETISSAVSVRHKSGLCPIPFCILPHP